MNNIKTKSNDNFIEGLMIFSMAPQYLSLVVRFKLVNAVNEKQGHHSFSIDTIYTCTCTPHISVHFIPNIQKHYRHIFRNICTTIHCQIIHNYNTNKNKIAATKQEMFTNRTSLDKKANLSCAKINDYITNYCNKQ